MISAVVLAAGESKRMGRPKQMLAWRGKTLLRHVLDSLIDSDVDEIILVLGHEAEAILKSLSDLFKPCESRDPSARWTFFDPASPRFAAKTKLALRAQTVVFAGAPLRRQGAPKNLQCALPESDFHRARNKVVINPDYTQGMASSLRAGLLALDPGSEAFLVLLADQPGIGPEIINRMIRGFRQADPRRGIVRPLYRGRGGHPVLIGARYLQEALQLHGDVGARQILIDHPGDILEIDVDKDSVLMDIDTPEEYEKLTI
jgi:CTP:molybdopterin cytidylyltransferase MocA